MSSLDDFSEIVRHDVPLAPLTWLKLGGPAQLFIEPRNPQELVDVVRCCYEEEIPTRILGGGSNLLVRDEGVSGAVIRVLGDGFAEVSVDGTGVTAGSGVLLSNLVSRTLSAGLAGLETLVGIPGTVGGALHGNAGGRSGDIGQFVQSVKVVTAKGEVFTRSEDELSFAYRSSSVNELAVLEASFELVEDDPQEVTRRMRKLWIMKKAAQPFSFQSAGCMFKNPRGLSAGSLIEQAGLKGTRVGGCAISDRHANFLVSDEGATSEQALQLIELIRSRVAEVHGVDLELEIQVW